MAALSTDEAQSSLNRAVWWRSAQYGIMEPNQNKIRPKARKYMETEIRGTEERLTGRHRQLYRQHTALTMDRHPAPFEPAIPASEWRHNDLDGHLVRLT
jgi:hypothetical protein